MTPSPVPPSVPLPPLPPPPLPQDSRFGARLVAALRARGPLCAGIDPHPALLASWGLADDVAGLERFALTATEILASQLALVKPQSAFFERHGARGIAVLERVLRVARQAGALVLLDVKRADIGSTMLGYADAYLRDAAPLAADAITVSPYLGVGALRPAFEAAQRTGRGVFVLARTSNPEGARLQAAVTADGITVAQSVVDEVAAHNIGRSPLGDVGVVIGATAPVAARLPQLTALNGAILAPGIGAQHATLADLPKIFSAVTAQVVPTVSRQLLQRGPDPDTLRRAAREMCDLAATLLWNASGQVDGGTPR